MEIQLLDVGNTRYGDCIVVRQGNRSILIDAAHPGDTNRITGQLRQLFGHEPPFNFDLLVVTHCHLDHIGCLPQLVEDRVVSFGQALVADERFGWGRDVNDDSASDALSSEGRKLVLALQEEPLDDAPDDEVRQFLEDVETLETKYRNMLGQLHESGTDIVRYGRDAASRVTAIEEAFSDFGMKVIGPTQDHLLRCAQYISESTHDAVDALRTDRNTDAPDGLVSAYRRAVRAAARRAAEDSDAPMEDMPGVGAAKNNQSIVLKFSEQGKAALLAGDMQFAAAEVPGLNEDMTALRSAVAQHGPYDFIKLTHHTSYNGFDLDVWNEWITPSDTYRFAHTGGRNDSGHPNRGVLQLLREYRDQLQFARTDRNGRITVRLEGNGVTMAVSRGRFNNFARNSAHDESVEGEAEERARESGTTIVQAATGPQEVIELTAKVPSNATRVTITVDLVHEKKN